MRYYTLPLLVAAMLALPACKKDDGATASNDVAAPSGLLGAAADQAKASAASAALPQPNPDKPLSSYPELNSGNQIMFLYVAASKLPPDYTKLAESYSSEYRSTIDTFRKSDLLQAIKPQLDQKIALANATPYGWMQIDQANLGPYDFERKGFPIGEFNDDTYRYFNDNSSYKIGWANFRQVSFAPVIDEGTARRIEAMRSDWSNTPRLKVYFFAQSADLDNERVNALVTHVQITDKSGRVLTEYGPDGSTTVSTNPNP